jgi:hypothetical protein
MDIILILQLITMTYIGIGKMIRCHHSNHQCIYCTYQNQCSVYKKYKEKEKNEKSIKEIIK